MAADRVLLGRAAPDHQATRGVRPQGVRRVAHLAAPRRAPAVPGRGSRPGGRPALDPLHGVDADLQRSLDAADLRGAAAAAPDTPQPPELRRRARSAGVRKGGLLHDQHELAVVLGRVDDVVLLPDDSAGVPQLHVGRGGRVGRGGVRPRYRAPLGRAARQLLGRSGARHALLFVQQGVIQNFAHYVTVTTVEGAKQILAMGPVASQEAIKQLGTNGGGFFNANSAHPFENPTPWTNFWQMLAIFAIPAALTYTYGRMAKNQKHGWALWAAMYVLFISGVAVSYWAEARGNPIHAARGVDIVASATNPGGNMEGKEVRFGIANSALYATMTTDASCGCVNAMHDSFTPIGGLVPLVNMQLGEVVYGGVGAGLYGMLVMVVLTVFIAGLMVGRTPEYLGKKIQAREVQMAMLYVLVFAGAVLTLSALAAVTPAGLAGRNNAGPHGLSEIVYAFTSTAANNGSAFAGLTGSTYFYNTLLGLNTLIGRFAMHVPMLALGGFLAEKKIVPESAGTFPVTTPLVVLFLVSVSPIVSALTFFPVLSLGLIFEHFLRQAWRLF